MASTANPVGPALPIDYTSKDFDGFKASMLTYAQTAFPAWAQASEGDFGMLLVELFAYNADILSYYGDQIANEAYIDTAVQRRSVLNLAQLLNYLPHGPIPSTGTVTLETNNPGPAVVIPAGTQFSTDFDPNTDTPLLFENLTDVTVPANGGTAVASLVQGQTFTDEIVAQSDGTMDQQYKLFNSPVIDGSVSVIVGDSTTGFIPYSYVAHLVDAGPADTVFTVYTDENNVTWVQFGDGVNGIVPPSLSNIEVTYRVGGGVNGNIAAGLITQIVTQVDGVSISVDANGVPISSAFANGADKETTDDIRVNAPRSWSTQDRCTSLEDYENAAVSVAAVTKASAIAKHFASVTVYISGPAGSVPTQSLIDAVQSFLSDPKRCGPGVTVSVAAASLVPVNVTLTLGVLNNYSQSSVKTAVVQAIQNVMAYTNTDFGSRVSVAGIYRAIAEVPGVDYADITNLARADAAQGVVTDVLVRDWEIPTFGTILISSTSGGIS